MASFKPGDYVRFIHAKEEGRIIRAYGSNEWEVETSDGFRMPVMASEIVKVQGPEPVQDEAAESLARKATGKQLAVVPFNDQNFDLYLINDSKSICHYTLYDINKSSGLIKGINHGIIPAFTAESLVRLNWQQLQDEVQGALHLCYYENEPIELPSPIEFKFKITGLQVLRSNQTIPVLEKRGYLLPIESSAQQKKTTPAVYPLENNFPSPQISTPEAEVDLHIEKLIPEHNTLNAAEMLRIQLDTFEKQLDLAVAHGRSQIIFIHGIGNGILKSELHKRLGRNKHVASFSDAKKEKFGYGATLVELK